MPQQHNFQMMEDTFEGSVLENSVWTANQQKSHATILSRNRFEKGKYIMLESGKKKTNKQTNKQTNTQKQHLDKLFLCSPNILCGL